MLIFIFFLREVTVQVYIIVHGWFFSYKILLLNALCLYYVSLLHTYSDEHVEWAVLFTLCSIYDNTLDLFESESFVCLLYLLQFLSSSVRFW